MGEGRAVVTGVPVVGELVQITGRKAIGGFGILVVGFIGKELLYEATQEGIDNGRDEVLEAAIEYLKGEN